MDFSHLDSAVLEALKPKYVAFEAAKLDSAGFAFLCEIRWNLCGFARF